MSRKARYIIYKIKQIMAIFIKGNVGCATEFVLHQIINVIVHVNNNINNNNTAK